MHIPYQGATAQALNQHVAMYRKVSNNTVIADVLQVALALTEGSGCAPLAHILYGHYLAVSDQILLAWPHPTGLDVTLHLLVRRTAAKEDWQLAPAAACSS